MEWKVEVRRLFDNYVGEFYHNDRVVHIVHNRAWIKIERRKYFYDSFVVTSSNNRDRYGEIVKGIFALLDYVKKLLDSMFDCKTEQIDLLEGVVL
jgi:hypothetical protein